MPEALGPELQRAMDDATLAGSGWVQIRRLRDGSFDLRRVDSAVVSVFNALTVRLSHVAEATLAITCTRCDARVGQPCVTADGRPTTPHNARLTPIMQAYDAGRRVGAIELLRQVVDDWDTPAEALLARHGVKP